jgi:hypothetical protein
MNFALSEPVGNAPDFLDGPSDQAWGCWFTRRSVFGGVRNVLAL